MSDEQHPKRKRGRPPKNNETSPQKLQMIADTERAWELRAQGKTYREIASALGVSVSTAYEYIHSKTKQIENRTDIDRKQYQATQLDDIERAIELLWKQISVLNSVNKNNADVDDTVSLARARSDTIKTLSNLLNRQAKLLGLDAPTQVEDVTPRETPYIIFGFDPTTDD